jgi:hypothetical protein
MYLQLRVFNAVYDYKVILRVPCEPLNKPAVEFIKVIAKVGTADP